VLFTLGLALLGAGPATAAVNARAASAGKVGTPGAEARALRATETISYPEAARRLKQSGLNIEVAVLPSTFYVRPALGAPSIPAGFEEIPAPVASAPRTPEGDPFGGRDDALPPPDGRTRSARARGVLDAALGPGLPFGVRWRDVSELMVGTVAVAVFFPESDGTLDPNKYDWTPALRDSVVQSAVRGLLRWTALAARSGVPLTFLIEVHPALATRYEPIDRRVDEEGLWMADALTPVLGYHGDYVSMAYEVANAARARLGTDWGTVLFAVQNATDPDGMFPDGLIAHAVLGGPYFVLPVNNLNTQSANLDYYVTHEMTHLFWALDEFPANNAWWACTLTTGYFDQPNLNSSLPAPGYCGVDRRCLMKGNYPDSLCAPTQWQVGWADRDQNGTLDLYETSPVVQPDSAKYVRSVGVPFTVRGIVFDDAWPNTNSFQFGFGDSITIATVTALQYRLDGGAWADAGTDDGMFDSGLEHFTVQLTAGAPGNHLLEFQAWNSSGVGVAVPASTVLTVNAAGPIDGGAAVPAAATLEAAPNPAVGAIGLRVRGPAGRSGVARVFDPAGRLVRAWRIQTSAAGEASWVWDGRRERGGERAGGVYFLRVELGSERLTRRIVLFR
jgi:hypothetical protein